MPSGPSRPPAPRPRSWPSARVARSSWVLLCTPAILTASSSCSAERWVLQRAPTPRPLLQAPLLSVPLFLAWPRPVPHCPARLGLASISSAKLAARSPWGTGSASPPGRAARSSSGLGRALPPPLRVWSPAPSKQARGVSGFSSDCRGAARAGSPFLVFPSPNPINFSGCHQLGWRVAELALNSSVRA